MNGEERISHHVDRETVSQVLQIYFENLPELRMGGRVIACLDSENSNVTFLVNPENMR